MTTTAVVCSIPIPAAIPGTNVTDLYVRTVILNPIALKSKDRKHYTGTLGKVREDKDTFMRFYEMKKDMLPSETTVYTYPQEEVIRWRPCARESSVMSYVGTNNDEHKFLIYAGLSNQALNEIVELKINEDDGTTKWRKALSEDVKMESNNEFGRYGISQVCVDQQVSDDSDQTSKVIYYYGGGKMFNKDSALRE